MKPESASKTKLLETAIDMIWASSYGSVSVDDICAKAGVNKGSFYYAFKSKSDLAVAAFERSQPFPNPPPGLVDHGLVHFSFGFFLEVNSASSFKIFRSRD